MNAAILRDALAPYDRAAAEDERPIRFSHAPVAAMTYLQQREVFTRIARQDVEALFAEEAVLALLDAVLAAAYAQRAATEPPPGRGAARSFVEAAQQMIGRRFNEPLTLDTIAGAVGCSAYICAARSAASPAAPFTSTGSRCACARRSNGSTPGKRI